MNKRYKSYQHFSWTVTVHADGEVVHGQGDILGVGHSFVSASVLILDQHLEGQEVSHRTRLERLGKYVGAGALKVVAAAIKRAVVRVSCALAGGGGERVAVPDTSLQGALFAALTAHQGAHHLGKHQIYDSKTQCNIILNKMP